LHNRDGGKKEEFSSSFISLRQGWLEGEGDDEFKWIRVLSLSYSL